MVAAGAANCAVGETTLVLNACRTRLTIEDTLIEGPTIEPLDLEEVKKQRKVSSTSLDTLFVLWISAARQLFEEQTGCQLMTATYETRYDAFAVDGVIEVPHPPLQSVTSVTYLDDAGDEQTVDPATYTVLAPSSDRPSRGRIVLNTGAAWPTVITRPNVVRVRYVAGYGGAPGAVPELVKVALFFLVGHFHRFGEDVQDAKLAAIPRGADSIMQAWKLSALPSVSMWRWATWLD